jgi:hypothetical protein
MTVSSRAAVLIEQPRLRVRVPRRAVLGQLPSACREPSFHHAGTQRGLWLATREGGERRDSVNARRSRRDRRRRAHRPARAPLLASAASDLQAPEPAPAYRLCERGLAAHATCLACEDAASQSRRDLAALPVVDSLQHRAGSLPFKRAVVLLRLGGRVAARAPVRALLPPGGACREPSPSRSRRRRERTASRTATIPRRRSRARP